MGLTTNDTGLIDWFGLLVCHTHKRSPGRIYFRKMSEFQDRKLLETVGVYNTGLCSFKVLRHLYVLVFAKIMNY